MKTCLPLRAKLFLSIGGVFLLFFFAVVIVENFVVEKKLGVAKQILQKQLRIAHDQKRRRFETFLRKSLLETQARLDTFLYEMDTYPTYKKALANNQNAQIWTTLAQLLHQNSWIDYLQFSVEKPNAVAENFSLQATDIGKESVASYEINQELSWIFVKDQLYLSIALPKPLLEKILGKKKNLFRGEKLYFAYDWKTLLYTSRRSKKRLNAFEKLLENAKTYLRNNKTLLQQENFRELLKSSRKKKVSRKTWMDNKLRRDSFYQDWQLSFRKFLREIQIRALMQFSTLFSEKTCLAKGPLSPSSPVGIVYTELPYEKQVFLPLRSVFQTSFLVENLHVPDFSDAIEKKQLVPRPLQLHTIASCKDAYLTKTQYQEVRDKQTKKMALTAAVTIDSSLSKLAMASHQHVLFVEKKNLISIFSPQGEKLRTSCLYEIAPKEFGKKMVGIVSFRGEKYCFLRLRPLQKTAVTVFLLEPVNKALPILGYFHGQIGKIISSFSRNIFFYAFLLLLVALLFLDAIARKITKPITMLASAAQEMKTGCLPAKLRVVEKGSAKEIVTLLHSFNNMIKQLEEKEKVRGILNKMVSKQVASELLKKEVHLGGEIRKAVVLFADIRNFTRITEYMEPAKIIDILNTCMTKMTHIIEKNYGVVDKYVGDQVMALFSAPIPIKTPYYYALKTAVEIQESLSMWNKKRLLETPDAALIQVGVGIHGGDILAGNMGAEDRLNYTVLGKEVNLAARLCEHAQPGAILITEKTLQEESLENFVIQLEHTTHFKGLSQPETLYRVLGLRKS